MQEKVWAVVCQDDGGVNSVLVFDCEEDAEHFAGEMNLGGPGNYKVFPTSVNRRSETEAALSRIELPEFSAKCIECLVDIASVPEEERTAAAKYLEEHREELTKNAEGLVDAYIRKAITEFFDEDRVIHG